MAKGFVKQHEPLRVPERWTGQDRGLVIQLERLFDEVYNKLSEIREIQDELSSKVDVSDVANNLTTTAEGSVLDARQGKTLNDDLLSRVVGKRQQKSISASTTSCQIDLPAGEWFMILSLPSLSRTWVGIVYCGSNNAVDVEQINTQTGITLTTGTSMITATFSVTADTNLFMLTIPLRNERIPTFH